MQFKCLNLPIRSKDLIIDTEFSPQSPQSQAATTISSLTSSTQSSPRSPSPSESSSLSSATGVPTSPQSQKPTPHIPSSSSATSINPKRNFDFAGMLDCYWPKRKPQHDKEATTRKPQPWWEAYNTTRKKFVY